MKTALKVNVIEFYCDSCKSVFEGIPKINEFKHPVYGPCKTNVSNCPFCGTESSEFHKPKQKASKSGDIKPPCGMDSCGCCL